MSYFFIEKAFRNRARMLCNFGRGGSGTHDADNLQTFFGQVSG